jgi:heme/copper-type cytochrome/quinol oxidase subunit 4
MRCKNRVLTWTWLALVSATVLSWAVAEGDTAARVAGIVVLLVAVVKVGLVINRFMEIGRGSQGWEWFFLVWLLGVGLALVITSAVG